MLLFPTGEENTPEVSVTRLPKQNVTGTADLTAL